MEVDRKANVKEIDKDIKNKFRWDWLEARDDDGSLIHLVKRNVSFATILLNTSQLQKQPQPSQSPNHLQPQAQLMYTNFLSHIRVRMGP